MKYARITCDATFPLMAMCNVNGKGAHEVFKYLRKNTESFINPSTGKIRNIPWNFSKFIVNEEGKVIAYLNPRKSIYSLID